MRNHLTAVLPIYYCLLVKLQSLFGIIKEEINGKENCREKNFTQESNKLLHFFYQWRHSCGLLLSYFPIGEQNNWLKVKMNNVQRGCVQCTAGAVSVSCAPIYSKTYQSHLVVIWGTSVILLYFNLKLYPFLTAGKLGK